MNLCQKGFGWATKHMCHTGRGKLEVTSPSLSLRLSFPVAVPLKKEWKEERVRFGSQFKGTAHHEGRLWQLELEVHPQPRVGERWTLAPS